MASLDAGGKPSVRDLRAQFEQRASTRKLQAITPEQFFKQQKEHAEREAQQILLARKKAAAFNMQMRQLELKSNLKPAGSSNNNEGLSSEQEQERAKLRREARKLSVALRSMDAVAEEKRPQLQQQERRATHLLLASMAEELEQEMKKDELVAIREEEEAKERAAAAAEMARQEQETDRIRREKEAEEEAQRKAHEAEMERKRKELQMAHELNELARKQVEEDERIAQQERDRVAKEQQMRKQQQAEADEKDRNVLTSYLRENYPEKLPEVDALLEKFKGNLDVLFEELGKDQKFKESVVDDDELEADDEADEDDDDDDDAAADNDKKIRPSSVGATTVHSFKDDETVSPPSKRFLKKGIDTRAVITSFYQIYAASKLKDIDDILRHFENREADLFRTLEVKYDVTFSTDGTCTPNNGDRVGEPFMEAAAFSAASSGANSKFAVDVQARTLKDRLSKQGQPQEKVQAVLSSGSQMM